MKKILIINANYYKDITSKLVIAAKNKLKKNNTNIRLVYVPGVLKFNYN